MDILIVENDTVVTRVWSKKLSKEHTVRIAASVPQAVEEIQKKLPDLVILDLRLNGPTNSGLNVYEFIRFELDKDTPIIFITGLAYSVDLYQKAESVTEADTKSQVFTRFMEKPIKLSELSQAVNSARVSS
jgi:two-component system, NtrC family, nitrogen regulation response regulator NtrX